MLIEVSESLRETMLIGLGEPDYEFVAVMLILGKLLFSCAFVITSMRTFRVETLFFELS